MSTTTDADDITYLGQLVRADDRPRYYATLFAPAEKRADLFALYGFAAEIARIPDLVKEPTLGEIRLTWWRDMLKAGDSEPVPGEGPTPALRAIRRAMAAHALPAAPLEALIEARGSDLYANPPASMAEVEGRFGETDSALFQLAALILGARGPDSAEAAGHAGIAYGLARRLARFAEDRARGRTLLPAHLLAQEELTVVEVFAGEPPPALADAVTAMARFARHHLRNAQERLGDVPDSARSAFLPLAVVEPLLRRVDEAGVDILRQPTALSDLAMLTYVGWRRLRGFG